MLLVHHGLHVEIQVDRSDPIGKDDPAGVKDLLLEAAVSTIMDLEDSVAAVDADDKVAGYRNWLQLNAGHARPPCRQGRRDVHPPARAGPASTTGRDGTVVLPGRSLLFVRQVGHLMTTDAVLDRDGAEVPEGILDAVMTALCSLVDLQGRGELTNSRTGSMYAVKPKMHGPDEVALHRRPVRPGRGPARAAAAAPSSSGSWTRSGVPRPTSRPASTPPAAGWRFINTGFLDRTGDELHTSMLGRADGPQGRHEVDRVDRGLRGPERRHRARVRPRRQGPDRQGHVGDARRDGGDARAEDRPPAGRRAAAPGCPSPTAATLHALHYHQVDVAARQRELAGQRRAAARATC